MEEKINNRPSTQDGGASGAVSSNIRPSLLSNPGPSTLQPIQDSGLTAGQQLHERGRQTSFQPPPSSTQPPSSINPSLSSLDISDPAHVASLLPDFRQPSLASHLTKATSTAITNGECVDFATLLPLSSLLTNTINSQLNLRMGDQGLTISLPHSSKCPKITTIEKWLDAFAIYFSVIVSAYPSHTVDLQL